MFTLREQVKIMNTQPDPQNEPIHQEGQFLLDRALAALQNTTGIIGRIIAIEPNLKTGAKATAMIELTIGELRQRYMVEIKRIDRFAAIGQIKQQLDNL